MAVGNARPKKSTIVRALPLAMKALDRISPALAARWAERLWFTLPPRAQIGDALPGGEEVRVDLGGRPIAAQVWGTGPLIYLVHGWGGYGAQLAAFVEPLVAGGHRVVTFDALSHGLSGPGAFGPRSSSIPELAASLTAVATAYGPAHAVIAHSLGTAATAVALREGLPVGRVALLAPTAGPVPYVRAFAGALGLRDHTYRRLIDRIERRVGAPMDAFDLLEIGRTIEVPPTLIVHDRDDKSTPVTDGEAIANAWPGAKLQVTKGLGHRRLLRDPEVVADVVDFVSYFTAPATRPAT